MAVTKYDSLCRLVSLCSVECVIDIRSETDDGPDVLRWLDRNLIRLVGWCSLGGVGGWRVVRLECLCFSVRKLVSTSRMIQPRSVSQNRSHYFHRCVGCMYVD